MPACFDKLLKIEFWSVLLWNFDGFPIPSNLVSVPTHNVNDRRFPESNIIEDDDKEYPLFARFFLLLHNVCVCRGKISMAFVAVSFYLLQVITLASPPAEKSTFLQFKVLAFC